MMGKGGKLVIVNLQKTTLDHAAELVINAPIQSVMTKLMKRLGSVREWPIPAFRLERWIKVSLTKDQHLVVKGVDQNDHPFSFIKSVLANYDPS